MTHPPYSPNLAPSDFFLLFFQMKKITQKEMFCQCGRGETKNSKALKGIKMDEFKNCSEQWKKLLNSCIASNGEYFEGDCSLNM